MGDHIPDCTVQWLHHIVLWRTLSFQATPEANAHGGIGGQPSSPKQTRSNAIRPTSILFSLPVQAFALAPFEPVGFWREEKYESPVGM